MPLTCCGLDLQQMRGGKKGWAYAHLDISQIFCTPDLLLGPGEVSFKSCGGGRQQELRDSAWVLRKEELILSTPCLFAEAQWQRRGARDCCGEEQGTDGSLHCCRGKWPKTLEVTASGWLHSAEA